MHVYRLLTALTALPASTLTRARHLTPVGLGLTVMLVGILTLSGCTTQPPSKTTRANGPVDTVVVKKSQRQLELLSRGQVVRQYRVALGAAPVGHKYREGDQRTPEGRYRLNWRNSQSNFYKSMHISYPSDTDRALSRQLGYNNPGGMIMLHGLPNYIQSPNLRQQYANRDWTEGCIAVQNHEMDEIWSLVKDGTPIHIIP